jgi:uncharacterized coiled-coil protein SlyX
MLDRDLSVAVERMKNLAENAGAAERDVHAINTQVEEHNKNIADMTKTYNDKYGSKSDDELTGPEKVSMKKLNNAIESEKQAIEQIKAQQKGVIDKFNQLVAQVRAKLGR